MLLFSPLGGKISQAKKNKAKKLGRTLEQKEERAFLVRFPGAL